MRIWQRVGLYLLVLSWLALAPGSQIAQTAGAQQVEGFDSVVFAHESGIISSTIDFRGPSPGHMTATWTAPGQMKNNIVVWKSAIIPEKKRTTLSFIGSSSPKPPEFSQGPRARLFVNDHYVLTFDLGIFRDKTWKEGEAELKYLSRRVEWPYYGSHRNFELNGNSGIYLLTLPESQLEAGKPCLIKVEVLPFPAWPKAWFMVKQRRDTLQQTDRSLAEQVQQLQREVSRLGELTQVLATQQYNKLLETRELEHFIVYSNGYRHLHPADLIALKNGELLLTTREGTEHIARDGDVIMLRSRDGGKNWGDRQVIAGIPDLDEREGCGIQLKDGTLVLNVFFNKLYGPDGEYIEDWSRQMSFSHETTHLGSYTITSSDNGKTWTAPRYVNTRGMPFTDIEGPADAPIEMPDGSIYLPVMGYNVRGDMQNEAAVILKSSDKGNSWQYLSTMADDPGGKLGHFQEPALVRSRTGRLIAAMRNQGPAQAIWTCYSDDNGKSWSPPKQSPMIGHPPDLIQLNDGRILCSYGYRPGRHGDPGGIRACFSSDNGETWQIDQEVQIRKDFLNSDIGYPESLQLANGKVLTVYYFNLFGRFFIGGTIWRP